MEGALYDVYEDIAYLGELYAHSESFRLFTTNASNGQKEVKQLMDELTKTVKLNPVTVRFIEVLADNKRFGFIKKISEKYVKLYQQFNKEEKVTVISAHKLSGSEEAEVLSALKQNPKNAGKEVVLDFRVDEAIMGGLQIYTESEFMDLSLSSRLGLINAEINKLME